MERKIKRSSSINMEQEAERVMTIESQYVRGERYSSRPIADSEDIAQAYHEEAEWAQRKQESSTPDVIMQKNTERG